MDTITAQRSQLFSLLGRIFVSELDEEMIKLLQHKDIVDVFEKLYEGYEEYICQEWKNSTLEDLAADYCHLFILPDKHSLSLKASHWSADSRTSEKIENLVGRYRHNTLHSNTLSSLPNDHLGILLNFIAHLLDSNNISAEKEADTFIQLALQPWVKDFTQKLNERSNNPLYCASSQLLLKII